MAIHTDPRTGERREVDDLVQPTTYGSSWGVIGALIIAVALAAFFFFERSPTTVETPESPAVTQPAPTPTNPAPPTPSATSPAPEAPATPSNETPAQPPATP